MASTSSSLSSSAPPSTLFSYASQPSGSNPLRRYFHHGDQGKKVAPYALITGSTGGMGEEWAYQLAQCGFNIILQGRNASKLDVVRSGILARTPECQDIRILVTEATVWPNPRLTTELTDLLSDANIRLTVVINNLGTSTTTFPLLEEESVNSASSVIISNCLFPAEITRLTLPHLKRNQPSLLANVTSLGAWHSPPFVSPYIGTKGFDVAFSRSLFNEMAVLNQQVDVVCIAPGLVVSGMYDGPPSPMSPTSAAWVNSAITSLSPGWKWWNWSNRPPPVLVPWKWHYAAHVVSDALPKFVSDTIARSKGLELKQAAREKSAKQQ